MMGFRNAIQRSAGRYEAVVGDTIARGFVVNLGEGRAKPSKSTCQRIVDGNANADDILNLSDRGVGIWWGILGRDFDMVDIEGYAETGSEEWLSTNIEDYDDYGPLGEVSIILVGERPQSWEPSDNGTSSGSSIWDAGSYMVEGQQIRLKKIRYNAGRGWREVNTSIIVTAMPGWRNKSNGPFWMDYDAVIAPEWTPRGNSYDVWAKQEIVGTAHSLTEAKAVVERVYGPQEWHTEKMVPYLDVDAPSGPTTEFSSPKQIYVVDFLATR